MPEDLRFRELRCHLRDAYAGPVRLTGRQTQYQEAHHVCWLLQRGSVDLAMSGWQGRILPGTWIILPPERPRDLLFTADAVLWSVRIGTQWRGLPVFDHERPLLLPVATVPALTAAAAEIIEAVALLHPEGYDAWRRCGGGLAGHCRAQAAAWAFLEHLHATAVAHGARDAFSLPHERRLAAAISLLEGRASAGPISYAALARATGLSRVHLDRLFQRHLGMTPRTWMDRILRERACDELRRGATAKAAAMRLGFSDASHFTKWFRRQVGCTPVAYRDQAQP